MNKSPKLRTYLKIIYLVETHQIKDGEIWTRIMWGSDVGITLKTGSSWGHLYTLSKPLGLSWHGNISLTQYLVHISICQMLRKNWTLTSSSFCFQVERAKVGNNYASVWPILWPRNVEFYGKTEKGHQSQSRRPTKIFRKHSKSTIITTWGT